MTDPVARPRTTTSERNDINRALERMTVMDALNAKLAEFDRVWGDLNASYERGDLSMDQLAKSQLIMSRATMEFVVMLMDVALR